MSPKTIPRADNPNPTTPLWATLRVCLATLAAVTSPTRFHAERHSGQDRLDLADLAIRDLEDLGDVEGDRLPEHRGHVGLLMIERARELRVRAVVVEVTPAEGQTLGAVHDREAALADVRDDDREAGIELRFAVHPLHRALRG